MINSRGSGTGVIAADPAGLTDVIELPPAAASLRGLDGVNLFLAGALSGFGPYVAVFLASQNWTQQNIGFVLTAAGLAGLLSQLPGGELLDRVRSKRTAVALGAIMVAAGALIIALWPSFPLVLTALVLQGITGGFLWGSGSCHQRWLGRPRGAWQTARAQSALRLDGRGARGRPNGAHRLFPVVSCHILRRRRTRAAATCRSWPHPEFRHPVRGSRGRTGPPGAGRIARNRAPEPLEKPHPARIRRLRVLVPDGQCVDAATRRRGARLRQRSLFFAHRLGIDHGPPDNRSADGLMGGTPGKHLGAPGRFC